MELTTRDKELLDGLQVLTDQEIGRVQAHLAAGLPMQTGHTGYVVGCDEPATNGCLVGVSMRPNEAYGRGYAFSLAMGFDMWVNEIERWKRWNSSVAPATLDRLAAILDMEWSRRHPLPVDETIPVAVQIPQPVGAAK